MENALAKIKSNPVSAQVYERLVKELEKLGSYEVENKKTSLHIVHSRAFLGVHPRKHGILLNIVTSEPLENERLKKVERVSANRYHNEILVTTPSEIDEMLQGWLELAYSLTSN
ncbi:DNA replication protein DnaC [Candidatus Saccharibacteria bacterium]|nr:DNA replication protein DnaC [Candidatus Saccharibacteria bacterium]